MEHCLPPINHPNDEDLSLGTPIPQKAWNGWGTEAVFEAGAVARGVSHKSGGFPQAGAFANVRAGCYSLTVATRRQHNCWCVACKQG